MTRTNQILENPIRALAKADHLLEQLAQEHEATPRRIAELIGEPRTTTYRLLRSLEALDLVEAGSQSGSYRLGWKLMRLGAAVIERLDERQAALPVMEHIHERVGETVFLLLRREWDAVCVERLDGVRVQSLALRLGGSLPLHVGAGPRALLAWESHDLWNEYVATGKLAAHEKLARTTRTALFRDLEAARDRGYTVSDEDVTPGIASLGAPIVDYRGTLRAALSVGGLKSSILGDAGDELVALLIEGAHEVSAALGHRRSDGVQAEIQET